MRLQNKILQLSIIGICSILVLGKVHADELRCDDLGGAYIFCSGLNYRPHGIIKYEKIIDKSGNFYFGKYSNIESGFLLFNNIKLIYDANEKLWFLMSGQNKILPLPNHALGEVMDFTFDGYRYHIIIEEFNIPIYIPNLRAEMVNTISLSIERI